MAAVDTAPPSIPAEGPGAAALRPPPLDQSDAVTSLLSLSIAAAAALPASSGPTTTTTTTTATTTNATATPAPNGHLSTAASAAAGKHHRRAGSTSKTRRRLSDAREASARPLLASSPGLSLASLSLSTSPPSGPTAHAHGHSRSLSGTVPHVIGHGSSHGNSYSHSHSHSHSYGYSPLAPKPAPAPQPIPVTAGVPITIVSSSGSVPVSSSLKSEDARSDAGKENGTGTTTPIPINSNGKSKKRGVDYRCESCNKIYRHPNCLNKHRWEHTRQWREASKFVLSKHQQVQLLEAAAILSFMGKDQSCSLPEDRSEWPSFLSGGSLPKAGEEREEGVDEGKVARSTPMPAFGSIGRGHSTSAVPTAKAGAAGTTSPNTYPIQPHPISASVPNPSSIAHSVSGAGGPRMHDYSLGSTRGVTQVAPGLVGVPTPPGSIPPSSASVSASETTGWSLPSSSMRSGSRSRSRSGSGSGSGSGSSEDVDIDIDIVGEEEENEHATTRPQVVGHSASYGYGYGYPGSAPYNSYGGYSASPAGPMGYRHRSHSQSSASGYAWYDAFGPGAGVKEEEEEEGGFHSRAHVRMSVAREDLEEEEGEEDKMDDGEDEDAGRGGWKARRGVSAERKWNGMEMEVDMDMD